MQIYRVLLIGWFQSGSVVQSCCCWGRTGELPFKMREGAGQKRCGQSWWGWGCVGCGIGAVVQRCNGKRPDSAGGGGGGRVTGVSDITSSPSAFSTPPPLPRFTARLRQCAAGAFKRSWSCLGNTAETRRNVRTDSTTNSSTERSIRDLTVWLTLSLWKGFRKFPPISPSSLGVPGWLFILRLPGELWGKGCKGHLTKQIYKL